MDDKGEAENGCSKLFIKKKKKNQTKYIIDYKEMYFIKAIFPFKLFTYIRTEM